MVDYLLGPKFNVKKLFSVLLQLEAVITVRNATHIMYCYMSDIQSKRMTYKLLWIHQLDSRLVMHFVIFLRNIEYGTCTC